MISMYREIRDESFGKVIDTLSTGSYTQFIIQPFPMPELV
jgi:hypothetical protein